MLKVMVLGFDGASPKLINGWIKDLLTLKTIISATGTILVVRLLNPPQYRPYTITLIPCLHQPIPQ